MDGKKKLEELIGRIERLEPCSEPGDVLFIRPSTIRSISDAYKAMEAAAFDAEYALTGIIGMLDFDEDDSPDEPCDAEELCCRDVCDQCGCVKDKRDRLRQILGVSRHEG